MGSCHWTRLDLFHAMIVRKLDLICKFEDNYFFNLNTWGNCDCYCWVSWPPMDHRWANGGSMSARLLCQRWAVRWVNGWPTSVNIGQTSNEPRFSASIHKMHNLEKLSSVWEYIIIIIVIMFISLFVQGTNLPHTQNANSKYKIQVTNIPNR